MTTATIGNGLYFPTSQRLSLIDQYKLNQATCEHKQRDPKGTCYRCGHKEGK